MSTPPNVWTEQFRVRTYETDVNGLASVPAICNYLQEAAGNHARALGLSVEQLAARNLTWVLSKFHVELDAVPSWQDDVIVETWPSGADRLYATRDFLIHDAEWKVRGRGTSAWLLIDLERRRPIRIPDFINEIRLAQRDRALCDLFDRLPSPADDNHDHDLTVQVRYSDLDLNRHVNHVRYVAWAVDTLPGAVLEHNRLTSIEVHYRAETDEGDVLIARAARGEGSDLTFRHHLYRADDGRDVALVRTHWTPRVEADQE